MTDIEKLFDPENMDPIIMVDEEGNEVEFEQIAILPYEGGIYALLKPITPLEGVGEDGAIVFAIEEQDGEANLAIVDDLAIIDSVFDLYESLVSDEK